jgi:hypothetical protein
MSYIAVFGGCCCLTTVLMIAGIVYFFFGRKQNPTVINNVVNPYGSSGGVPGAPPGAGWGNLVSRVTSDGFWMLGQSLQPGSIINYRYRSGNEWIDRSVPYQPGPDGHFVYLGHPPGNIHVTHVTPPGGNVPPPPPAPSSPLVDDELPRTIIQTPSVPSTGYPSAY